MPVKEPFVASALIKIAPYSLQKATLSSLSVPGPIRNYLMSFTFLNPIPTAKRLSNGSSRRAVNLRNYPSVYLLTLLKPILEVSLNTKVALQVRFELFNLISNFELNYLFIIKRRLFFLNMIFTNILFITEFIDVIFYFLKSKNISGFVGYLKKLFQRLRVWDHKRLTTILYNILKEQFTVIFNHLRIKGLHMSIRGKLGVGGDSRKRCSKLSILSPSISQFNFNIASSNTILTTPTGVLGLKIVLVYAN